jgi:protein kinase C substrate 80K-H
LYNECFHIKKQKYNYELCLFNSVQQKENTNSINLGKFKEFGNNEMKFEKGQTCWKVGPRKSTVSFKCSIENKVIKVDEPSTCEYVFEMETPCACTKELLNKKKMEINQILQD